jgi:hypothetical protein
MVRTTPITTTNPRMLASRMGFSVEGAPDLSHAAAAQQLDQSVASERSALHHYLPQRRAGNDQQSD